MITGAERLLLRTVRLTKTFRGDGVPVPAVRGVDLLLRAGEFAAITGPSGSLSLIHISEPTRP